MISEVELNKNLIEVLGKEYRYSMFWIVAYATFAAYWIFVLGDSPLKDMNPFVSALIVLCAMSSFVSHVRTALNSAFSIRVLNSLTATNEKK